jgi:predicted ATP-dependent protease
MTDDSRIDMEFIRELMSQQHLVKLTKQVLDYYILIGELEAENAMLRGKLKEFLKSSASERKAMRLDAYVKMLHDTNKELQKTVSRYRKSPPVPKNVTYTTNRE